MNERINARDSVHEKKGTMVRRQATALALALAGVLAMTADTTQAADTTTIAGQEVALIGNAGSLILPSGIYGTHGTVLEQVDEVTAKIEAMLAAGNLKVGDLMRHTIFLKVGAQEPSRIFTKLIGNLRHMGPELTNNPTAGTIVLVPSFPDPATEIMVEFVGGRASKGMTRVPIMFGPRMSVESIGNEQFVASFGLEGLDFYGAATQGELDTLKTLDGEIDKMVAILAANMSHAGLSIANVVSYNLYVTKGTDPVEAAAKLQHYLRQRVPNLGQTPSTGTVIVLDGATLQSLKVQLNVIASRSKPATLSRVPQGDVAQSVTADGVVFVSGIGGNGGAKTDAARQAEDAARGIDAALKKAGGLKLSDVARFDIYVKQGDDTKAALARFYKAARKLDPAFDSSKAAAVVAVVEGFPDVAMRFLASAVAARK